MYHYSVNNTAPRPESYRTGASDLLFYISIVVNFLDYLTANNVTTPLTDTQKAALYAELASGAETGMHSGNISMLPF
jgi:alpha,alpha-trehalase